MPKGVWVQLPPSAQKQTNLRFIPPGRFLILPASEYNIRMDERKRFRELGFRVGLLPCGPLNAITDVPGIRVGHSTIIQGGGALVPGKGPIRTGVTVILPHDGDLYAETSLLPFTRSMGTANQLDSNRSASSACWKRQLR